MSDTRWMVTAGMAALALAGCFGSHGMPDPGGPIPDAGPPPPPPPDGATMCLALEGSAEIIGCPMGSSFPEGTEIFARVQSSPSQCCASGTARPRVVDRGGGHLEIEVDWTACECCATCRCIGPIQELEVSLGRLPAGSYTIDFLREPACSFTVEPPRGCRPGDGDEIRMPRVISPDQELAATLLSHRASGCGCEPRVVDDGRTLSLAMQLCNCCDACDCIDSGYEASARFGHLMPGEYMLSVPHGVRALSVMSLDECSLGTGTGLTVVGPDPSLQQGGPRLWWARVEGEVSVCCAEPLPLIEARIGRDSTALVVRNCVRADCACVPSAPTPFVAWHNLGELGPGTHTVELGAIRRTFTVP